MKIQSLIITLCSLYIISACHPETSDNPQPSSSFTPAPIASTAAWYSSKNNTNDTMRVGNSSLYLTSSKAAADTVAYDLIYSVKPLKGDFELTVSYSGLKRSDTSSIYSSIYDEFGMFLVKAAHTDSLCVSSIVRNGELFQYDTSHTVLTSQEAPANGVSGQIYIKRSGSTFTAWMTCGNQTVNFSKSNYMTNDLTVYLFTQSNRQNGNCHVNIDDVTITGSSGGLQSDNFDTNAVVPAP